MKRDSIEWLKTKSYQFLLLYKKDLEDNVRFFTNQKKRAVRTMNNIEVVLNDRNKTHPQRNYNKNNPKGVKVVW